MSQRENAACSKIVLIHCSRMDHTPIQDTFNQDIFKITTLKLPHTAKTVPDCLLFKIRRNGNLKQSVRCGHSHDYDLSISVSSEAFVKTEYVLIVVVARLRRRRKSLR